jgi:hypothetical protein
VARKCDMQQGMDDIIWMRGEGKGGGVTATAVPVTTPKEAHWKSVVKAGFGGGGVELQLCDGRTA